MTRPLLAVRLAAAGSAVGVAIALAVPASADVNVTPPGSVKVLPGELVNVEFTTPDGYTCDTDWSVRTAGAPRVVEEISPVFCEDSLATWSVVVGGAKKGTGIVTFTATSPSGSTTSVALKLTIKKVKPKKPATSSNQGGTTTLAPPVGVG